jgi:hypothetical protein
MIMLATSALTFSIATFFVLFLIRSAHQIAKGKVVTFVTLIAWISMFSGLYLVLL